MEDKKYYVYILSSGKNGTLYVGVTNSIQNRINQHKERKIKGFTEKYNIDKLVYFEIFGDINAAIFREKQLKRWNREWKVKLIEKENFNWEDLYEKFF